MTVYSPVIPIGAFFRHENVRKSWDHTFSGVCRLHVKNAAGDCQESNVFIRAGTLTEHSGEGWRLGRVQKMSGATFADFCVTIPFTAAQQTNVHGTIMREFNTNDTNNCRLKLLKLHISINWT